MYKVQDLSRYIISKCINDNHPITNFEFQKILYYVQKSFVKKGKIAFKESIEAWSFGPVVPCVYYAYGSFGITPIHFIKSTFQILGEDKIDIDAEIERIKNASYWEIIKDISQTEGAWSKT